MISFSVDKLVSNTETGVVTSVEYHIKGNIGESRGRCVFHPPEDTTDFIPFEQLTKEDVLKWIESTGVYNPETIDNPALNLPSESYSIPW